MPSWKNEKTTVRRRLTLMIQHIFHQIEWVNRRLRITRADVINPGKLLRRLLCWLNKFRFARRNGDEIIWNAVIRLSQHKYAHRDSTSKHWNDNCEGEVRSTWDIFTRMWINRRTTEREWIICKCITCQKNAPEIFHSSKFFLDETLS